MLFGANRGVMDFSKTVGVLRGGMAEFRFSSIADWGEIHRNPYMTRSTYSVLPHGLALREGANFLRGGKFASNLAQTL